MHIKVGIVEDDKQIRDGISSLINGSEGFECIHTFESSEDIISKVNSLNLDVILMDIHLDKISGIECIQILKKSGCKSQFIMFTSFEDTDSIVNALKSGAVGYLTKTTQPSKILDSLLDVYKGGSPMSSSVARKLVSTFNVVDDNVALEKLSVREKEILEFLAKGFRYKEIADKLFLSTETVRTHIRNIYCKLQVNSRTDALNKIYPK